MNGAGGLAGMMRRYRRYAFLGLRILVPSPAEARYARAIRRSGLFDRDWYLASNPRLPRLCRWLPERHYVLVGEDMGLCPSPAFSPRAYLHLNPGLPAGTRPFAHYIAEGRAEGRAAHDLPAGDAAPALPVITPGDRPVPPSRFAVVLHLYYRDMWAEFAVRLRRLPLDFDLYVILPDLAADNRAADNLLQARIHSDFPQARIWPFPNHGRDILPFLHLAQSGLLSAYAAVCKLHGKKSPHRADGDAWRQALLDGVLGDPGQITARMTAFLADPAAGFWVANGQRAEGAEWWGPNRARATGLLIRAGLDPASLPPLAFAAGSIYWIRPAALAVLAAMPVGPADFEPEMGQVDGTTAHAVERISGLAVRAAGMQVRQAADLDGGPKAGKG